jgi:hypothetical protein
VRASAVSVPLWGQPSFDIQGTFTKAPKAVVGEERAQGKGAFLYPKGSTKNTGTEDEQGHMDQQYCEYTDHLQERPS